MNTAVVLTILQVIFLEGILSVDNAAALGALVKVLPNDEPVPWPRWIAKVGQRFDRALGPQRTAALKVGLLGAYLGRALMLALATTVMEQPWLRIVGGLYLLWLTINYLGERGADLDHDDTTPRIVRSNFWGVVLTVELVDLAFSLDNVVAVVALSQDYWVVMGGVAIGILIMRFAANIFTRLISWEPHLEVTAYLLVGAISIELLLNEFFQIHFTERVVGGMTIGAEPQQFGVSILIVLLTLAFARLRWLAPLNVIWKPLLRVCMWLRAIIQWFLTPFKALLQSLRRQEPQPNKPDIR